MNKIILLCAVCLTSNSFGLAQADPPQDKNDWGFAVFFDRIHGSVEGISIDGDDVFTCTNKLPVPHTSIEKLNGRWVGFLYCDHKLNATFPPDDTTGDCPQKPIFKMHHYHAGLQAQFLCPTKPEPCKGDPKGECALVY